MLKMHNIYDNLHKFGFDYVIFHINVIHVFFYKHMKFRIQARLCLAIYDFETRIMLNFSRYQTTGMRKI